MLVVNFENDNLKSLVRFQYRLPLYLLVFHLTSFLSYCIVIYQRIRLWELLDHYEGN